MGNNQSNENTRKRMVYVEPKIKKGAKLISYEVLRKEKHEGCNFIRFYLDKYITYKDGNYKYIDFVNKSPFNEEWMVNWLDLNYIKNYNSTETFENCWDVIGMTKPIEGWVDSEGNVRDKDGNNISELTDCLGSIGEMLEQRNNMQAYMETSRHANNHAWTKQTSWDMPPGWK